MPVFDVTAPDGTHYEVTGPEGATEQQALAQVQAQHAPKYEGAPNPTLQVGPVNTHIPIPAGVSTALEGAGKFFNDVGVGARQLFTGQTQADKESEARDAPLMGTLPGKVGYATGALSTALAAPVTSIPAAAGVGALMNSVLPAASPQERLTNMAAGGAAGGLGQAVANGAGAVWRWLRTPAASTLTPSQQQSVQRALEMGYELTPAQVTGKRWQQNLEAALDSFPGASGRAQARVAGNQANTDRIVSDALDSAGGAIDQPTAAGAAMAGWDKGIAKEGAVIDKAYRDLLDGVPVDLGSVRPALEKIKAAQANLPPSQQGGDAMRAVDELLGSSNYTAAKAARANAPPSLNLQNDDIATAVRKLGGINPQDEAVGSLAKDMNFQPHPNNGPVFRRPVYGQNGGTQAGHSLDTMAQRLYEKGYISDPAALDEVMEKLYDSSGGIGTHYSTFRDPAALSPDNQMLEAMDKLTNALTAPKAGPAPKAGFLRDNPTIPGELAQDMRSNYGIASEKAYSHQDNQAGNVFRQMKGTIDDAIEQSLPDAAAGQFKATNERYGIGKAVTALSPKQQDAFLSQLYRGSKSPDQFFSFLGMSPDPEFQQVARGFLSRMIEGASTDGSVNAVKLGKLVNAANPDAKRFFGGAAIDVLNDVGRAGSVLSDKVPNSGTAQRLMWQGLLMAPGSVLGGAEGFRHGGAEGAMAGAGLGAALGRYGTGPAVAALYHSGAARNLLTKTAIDSPNALLADILRQYGASLPNAMEATSNR